MDLILPAVEKLSTVGRMIDSPIWLVTGASKGIGREVVEAAARSGAHVIAGSRNPDSLTQWAQQQNLDSAITAVPLDISSEEAVHATVAEITQTWGRIDVLVNNAGYLLHGGVEELSDAEVRRSFDVNVFGLLNVTRQVLPVMRAQRGGRIINMASISATITSPATGLYSATKAAVLMFSEALNQEGRELGIHATAICPGGVRTDFLDSSSARRAATTIDDYASVHAVEEQLARGNHRQGGDPRKVAAAILEVAHMPEPPSRIYLGDDALHALDRHAQSILTNAEKYRSLSQSITSPEL